MTHAILPHFVRFRHGQLSVEALQTVLVTTTDTLAHDSAQRALLEQTNTRIDAIVLGVCEAERDAHINELLQEIETKLITIEP
jgi:hypothetical protein